jgi:hypothetical protein
MPLLQPLIAVVVNLKSCTLIPVSCPGGAGEWPIHVGHAHGVSEKDSAPPG